MRSGCAASRRRSCAPRSTARTADAVAAAAGPAATALGGLLAATGPARAALMILTTIELPDAAQAQRTRLAAVVSALLETEPALRLTVDPVENQGFEYHNRHRLHIVRPRRARRARARRPLSRRRRQCARARAGDRLQPVHGYGAACRARGPHGQPRLPAPRHAAGPGARVARRWLGDPSPGSRPRTSRSPRRAGSVAPMSGGWRDRRGGNQVMSNVAVIGAQWGDEGKGKIVRLAVGARRRPWCASRAAIMPATRW